MIARLPIRVRLAATFALAMAAVLAGTTSYLYVRLDSHLSAALDRDLRLRAQDLGVVVSRRAPSLALDSRAALVERGESYAQVLGTDGRALDATQPLGRAPLVDAGELRSALARPLYADRRVCRGWTSPHGSSPRGSLERAGRWCSWSAPRQGTEPRRWRAFATNC
jgi:two-component system, OmpR family, sensor kinase